MKNQNFLIKGEYYRGNVRVFPCQYNPLNILNENIGSYNAMSSGDAIIKAVNHNAPYLLPYINISDETKEVSINLEIGGTLVLVISSEVLEDSEFYKNLSPNQKLNTFFK